MLETNATASPSKPLSILLVCFSYPPVPGGSEVEAQRVASTLIRRGHRVKVVCAGGSPMPPVTQWVDPTGVPVAMFGASWPAKLRGYPYAAGVVWTLLRHHRDYNVVYFLMQGLHLAVGFPLAHLLGLPAVMKFSGSRVIPLMMTTPLGRFELRLLKRWASGLMVLNEEMVFQAAMAGIPADRLTWMPNPVDTDAFAPASVDQRRLLRRSFRLEEKSPVVVFAGRFIQVKEIPSLFHAFHQVVKQHPDAVLAMLGDGELREDLHALAAKLGITSNVRFEGRVDSAAVLQWLQASDVFALVSSKEGFSCALVEAMAVGLPSLVSDIPANTQLIEHGVDGLLAPVLDSDILAANLLQLFGDPHLRKRMGLAARQKAVTNYSLDRVAERYEKLLGDVVDRF